MERRRSQAERNDVVTIVEMKSTMDKELAEEGDRSTLQQINQQLRL